MPAARRRAGATALTGTTRTRSGEVWTYHGLFIVNVQPRASAENYAEDWISSSTALGLSRHSLRFEESFGLAVRLRMHVFVYALQSLASLAVDSWKESGDIVTVRKNEFGQF